MKGRKNSGNRLASRGGELVAMSSSNFSDQAVGSQQAQPVTHAGGAPPSFLPGRSHLGEEDSLQVAVTEPVQGELPSAYRLQPRAIRREARAPWGVAFPGTVDAQVVPVVQGRFGAQHTPERRKGFVVKLHRVAVQGVLDADPSP